MFCTITVWYNTNSPRRTFLETFFLSGERTPQLHGFSASVPSAVRAAGTVLSGCRSVLSPFLTMWFSSLHKWADYMLEAKRRSCQWLVNVAPQESQKRTNRLDVGGQKSLQSHMIKASLTFDLQSQLFRFPPQPFILTHHWPARMGTWLLGLEFFLSTRIKTSTWSLPHLQDVEDEVSSAAFQTVSIWFL